MSALEGSANPPPPSPPPSPPPPPLPPPEEEEDSSNPNLAQWHHDQRVEWLREKVCIALDVPRSIFNTALETEEGSNTVRSFLDGSASCLLLYPDEIVSYIETIVEPPPPPPPPPLVEEEPPVEEAAPEEPAEGGKKGKKGKGKKEGEKRGSVKKGDKKDDKKGKDKKDDAKKEDGKKGGGKKGEKGKKEEASAEPEPPVEPGPGEEGEGGEGGVVKEVEEPWKPQIVIVEKRVPILSTSVGSLSEHALSVPVTYFLKMTSADQAISMENIDKDIEWGVMPSGPGMSSLDKVCMDSIVFW